MSPQLSLPVTQLIKDLHLQPHPEGGYYRETWRSSLTLAAEALPGGYSGSRAAGTLILFLLPTGCQSRWHRVRSEELWLHQAGDPLQLKVCPDHQDPMTYCLGESPCYQALVPALAWQSAEALPGEKGYALVGCVVVPGFDFVDFEMAD
ncbi:MAG: cupin domain-containing protein [Cyanobacteriota bacterium]|nr:cupin domain-containing protein [Cyanobacteriota bacterium]